MGMILSTYGNIYVARVALATGFYKAIGAGREIPFAYALGKAAIQLQGDTGEELPVLL